MNNINNQGSAMKSLRIIYFAMLAGTMMFSGIIYFISTGNGMEIAGYEKNIFVIALFLSAFALTISSYLWKKDISAISQQDSSLSEKFEAYRAASIKRYAITEFAALFSIICYFVTGELRLYIAVAILIIHFLTLFPTSPKIAAHIGESAEDIERL